MPTRKTASLILAFGLVIIGLLSPAQVFGRAHSDQPAFQSGTATPTPTRRPTRTPTATVTPTRRATRTPTATPTPTRPSGTATPTPTAVVIKRYFILAGQSNASGRGELDANTEAPDARVFLFGNDYALHQAYEPADDPTNQVDAVSLDTIARHGFALRAGKDLAKAGYGKLAVIPCPKGGSKLEQWWATSDPFDRATLLGSCNYRRQLVAGTKSISAVWWYQGEAENASETLRDAYTANHTRLVSDFRQRMGANLPFVYAQLAKNEFADFNHGYQLIAEQQRRLETGSGYPEALPAHTMVVTFDLPITGGVHLTQAGQKELGRRVALAMRQRVFGEAIDGTGPRLRLTNPIQYPSGDRTRIVVTFDQPINTAVANYDNQFRVFDADGEVSISSVVRHPSNTAAVRLTLARATVGAATLSYGDVIPPGAEVWLVNVVKGASNLPTPRFGPLPVADAGLLADAAEGDEAGLLADAAAVGDAVSTATPTPTESATPTVTPSPTESPTPTVTPSPTESATPTTTPSPTESPTPTPTATPSITPSPTPDLVPQPDPLTSPTATTTPTASPSPTPELMPLRLWLPLIRRPS